MRLLTGADFWALHDEPAVGLRRLVMSDGPAGVRGERWDEREPSANVPSPTLLAATWDEARIERLGRLLAAEARRKGVDVVLAPMVNLHRTPYGGRHFESFSEDPLLTGRIGAAYVRGLQAEGVAATVKHFVANDSETERFTLDARVAERALRELYLAPFEAIVRDAGAWTVMAAYNAVNGPTMTESPMLQEILHDEWGWDGLVMSDWTAARSTEGAGNAALDLAMPGPDGPWGDALVDAVRDGRVSEAAVDAKVLRLLRLAARVGALDGVEPAGPPARPWSDEAVAAELRETAAAGFVLARNDGVLPLERPADRRCSARRRRGARTLGGGSATVFPPYTVSPLEGLQAAGLEVTHAPGVRAHTRIPPATPELLPGGVRRALPRRARTASWAPSTGTAPPSRGSARCRRGTAAVELRATLSPADAGRARRRRHRRRPPPARARRRGAVRPARRAVRGRRPRRGRPAPAPVRRAGDARRRPASCSCATSPSPTLPMAAVHLNVEPPFGDEEAELERAVALAAEADVAVVVVGTNEEVECEGVDRDSLALPGRQDELVARVAAANPRTVVVVNAGAPVLLPWAGRRRRHPARLVPGPGVRQRARRRPHRRRRARRPAAHHLAEDARRACRRPRRRTASSPTTRASSSATAPTSATAASRCSRSGTASATRPGSTSPSSRPTPT